MATIKSFTFAQIIYVVERSGTGFACSIGAYRYVTYLRGMVLAQPSENRSEIDAHTFVTNLLYETVDEETTGICAFPLKDCYGSFEQASRAQDIENFRKMSVTPSE